VKAVEKGRAIYAGIQKFVAFIMSVHIAEAAWGLVGWLG
jgi:magnesium-transporting ATPase (P-type)